MKQARIINMIVNNPYACFFKKMLVKTLAGPMNLDQAKRTCCEWKGTSAHLKVSCKTKLAFGRF